MAYDQTATESKPKIDLRRMLTDRNRLASRFVWALILERPADRQPQQREKKR
jgi:hypothetical protein